MRKIKKEINFTGFNVLVKDKKGKYILAATGFESRHLAHKYVNFYHPGSVFKLEGTRLDYTPIPKTKPESEVKEEK